MLSPPPQGQPANDRVFSSGDPATPLVRENRLMAPFAPLRRLGCRSLGRRRPKGRPRLSLETLESRDLLASGPAVVSVTPVLPQGPPLTTVTVTFNEPIDPATFTLSTSQQARNNVAAQLASSPEGLRNRA